MVPKRGRRVSGTPNQDHWYRRLWNGKHWQYQICVGICAVLAWIYLPGNFSFFTDPNDLKVFNDGLQQCFAADTKPKKEAPISARENPRWNAVSGQKRHVILHNATLFDGEKLLPDFVDIEFNHGVVRSVTVAGPNTHSLVDAEIIDVKGKHVTPGLVDMHSHHLLMPFSSLQGLREVNEQPFIGPLTPFVRMKDGFTASDAAIRIIASGGVTTSLVLPGSTNIIGGQAYPVKNFPFAGAHGEPIIEELLLEHGIPEAQRQRYLKMACGENSKGAYGHTRPGLAWLLREKLAEAQDFDREQSEWCRAARDIENGNRFTKGRLASGFLGRQGRRPRSLEFEPLLALLRGEFNINMHCYAPEDMETMLSVLHEFGVHPQAFHHALEAWQVPEMLKKMEPNITIATFADYAFFKAEAYGANLRGPKILDEGEIKVALKSDHVGEHNLAKYLLDQASVSHSFGLPAEKALRAVTSVPARSMDQGHRIGYVRPGYDADIVIWDDHPLQVGATAVQVFIDGRPSLQSDNTTKRTLFFNSTNAAPAVRKSIGVKKREEQCFRPDVAVLITGITGVLIDHEIAPTQPPDLLPLAILVQDNKLLCMGTASSCAKKDPRPKNIVKWQLGNGYITPGLVAFGNNLGMQDIPSEPSTGDGTASQNSDILDEAKVVHFAKYGVHLHGRAFDRARIGGVTKAISAPRGSGVIQGVSVGVRTGPDEEILGTGIWKDEVALHFVIGQGGRNVNAPTVGSAIEVLRQILAQGKKEGRKGNVYARAAHGSLPVVVQAFNQDDIAQVVLVKRDFPLTRLILYGCHGAALVAKSLAKTQIPVILTGNRGAADTWEKKDTLPGPPLSESPAKVLLHAGVKLGLGFPGDYKLHGLAREAQWVRKFTGLSEKESIALVSTNIEEMLGVEIKNHDDGYEGDFVVWKGNPLRGEGTVVLSVKDGKVVGDCWPDDGLV